MEDVAGGSAGQRRRERVVLAPALALALSEVLFSPTAIAGPASAVAEHGNLVGVYDGNQIELASRLELRADGRFSYLLSYGALDEEAEGRWTALTDGVLLTSDPVAPPRFKLIEQHDTPDRRLLVSLDLPHGLSRQYFEVVVVYADGGADEKQFAEEAEPLVIETSRHPRSITLLLPVYELRTDPIQLSGAGGHWLRFRFEPNDLGKVAFARTPLRADHGELILVRHDRIIHFRQVASSSTNKP